MAVSPKHAKEIPDSFFMCTLCGNKLQEPKLLTCLHRFCRDCLREVMTSPHSISCPECSEVTFLPDDGVKGLETDVHTKQLMECSQAKTNILKDKRKGSCAICEHHKRCAWYCFKCTGFLCDDCHHLHLSDSRFKPHSAALINVRNVDEHTLKLAFKALTRLMDAPKCHVHHSMFLDVICISCDRLDICMGCKFGPHEKHKTESIKDAAQRVREELQTAETEFAKPDGFWEGVQERVDNTHRRMKEIVRKRLDDANAKVKRDINVIQAKKEYVKEIRQKVKRESTSSLTSVIMDESKDEDDLSKFTQQRMDIEKFNDGLVRFLERLKDGKLSSISDSVPNLSKRYKNIQITTDTVLTTEHDWAALKCVPRIILAMKVLEEDLKKILAKTEFWEKVNLKFIPSPALNHFGLIQVIGTVVACVNMEGFASAEWTVRGISSIQRTGGFLVSSHNSQKVSKITHFALSGGQKQNMDFPGDIQKPWRYLASLSPITVATVCQPTEIGVFNHDTCNYVRKDLTNIVGGWTRQRWVQSIAACPSRDSLFIGSGETNGMKITGSNEIEVLDLQLNHKKTVTVPEISVCPQSLAVYNENLLICDYYGKRALSCDMDGNLVYEFPNLELEEGDWQPFSVCVDSKGFVYILWDAKVKETWKQIVIRYSPEGQPLTVRVVDMDAMCITIATDDEGIEKLIICTRVKGEVTVCDLL
ncbi:E3 ubiquitin-protein ligase TRIM56 [Holothuria leucospilota]|uniref:E3 ubiquitin-protein ligase TRIM56 n=1 Tax=Holothuria leucospilota TaxID=206669 RepID=A0A9Q1CPJ1_HOLLE|nr:E3 ubiquitin-protein ligase TRIM56 [Holothuria leucospilota]